MKTLYRILFSLIAFASFQNANAQWNLPGTFGSDIDGAILNSATGIMLFKGGEFTIYGGEESATYPLSAINNWPANWEAITATSSFNDQTIMLFSGSSFLTLDVNSNTITGGDIWGGLPVNWGNQIDAAVNWQPGVIYLFHGQEFIAYDSNTESYGPVTNLATWGLPNNWNNTIDAAINVQDGSVYFFRGTEYIIYDQQAGSFSPATSINEGANIVGNIPPPGANNNNVNTYGAVQQNYQQNNSASQAKGGSSVGSEIESSELPIDDTFLIEEINFDSILAAAEKERLSIRPTGPFPDEYRDDYKPFTDKLMALTWGAATSNSIRPMAAKNWIGTGVDIIYVDPLKVNKSKRAPKSAIVLTDSDIVAGNASEYIIPFGTKFESIGSSETTESDKTLKTYGEFQSKFGGSVGGSISVPAVASGSASASMSQMNRSTFGTENVYTYKQCVNQLYKVSLSTTWIDNKTNQKYRQKLDEGFKRLVGQLKVPSTMPSLAYTTMKKGDKLPSTLNSVKPTYLSIVKYYGTHLTQSVTFGGRFISIYEISRSTYENARMTEAGFEAAVSATIKGVEIGASAAFDYGGGSKEGQKSSTLSARTYITGGNASNFEKWNDKIDTAPAAIEFELMPISDLLTERFFPNDPDIEKKAEILKAVMFEYVVNRMKEAVPVDLTSNSFFKELKPLEYDYDIAIQDMKCEKVSSGESGSANEYYGTINFNCNGKTKKALDIDEDDAWELVEGAQRTYTMREPFVITLAEDKTAILTASGEMFEDDDSSKDDVLGTASKTLDISTVKNQPKKLYLDFEHDGDKVTITVVVTRKMKVESY